MIDTAGGKPPIGRTNYGSKYLKLINILIWPNLNKQNKTRGIYNTNGYLVVFDL